VSDQLLEAEAEADEGVLQLGSGEGNLLGALSMLEEDLLRWRPTPLSRNLHGAGKCNSVVPDVSAREAATPDLCTLRPFLLSPLATPCDVLSRTVHHASRTSPTNP